MVFGVLAALVPLGVATRHQQRYGHHGSRPGAQGTTLGAVTPTAPIRSAGTVCPSCSAFVVDQAAHDDSVHVTVAV
jgi:hypothetical protein